MRLINLEQYKESTMELARPVYDRHRRILLAEGRTIHPKVLKRFLQMDIRFVFVEDAVSKGITMEEMLDMPTWMDAIELLQKTYESVKRNDPFPLRELQDLVRKLINEVYSRPAIILVPSTYLAEELRHYAHAVNVCLLSIQVGKKKGYNQIQVKDLAFGALLHDIGKAITNEESEHPLRGFDIIRKYKEISLLAAHVAYQHHEALDGSGYPRELHQQNIHDFAQICGISNLFENLTSNEGYPPHEALEIVMTKSGTIFKEELVQVFVQEVPFYPPGTKIKLNTGDLAIVTRIQKNLQRPLIRFLENDKEISLEQHPTYLISEVIHEEQK